MTTARQDTDTHEHDEMLTIDEAAQFLRVPVATMRYWRYCGTGPFSFKVQRHVRYWRSDLVLWRAEQGRAPGSPQGATRSSGRASER
ncbi:MerR family transcriptional regulator [Nocardioides aromaticivorans]|uniref:MerR family transcriptional regulator n=1 Tax=Nocardioides aromaticivorans TaxID=200618 RepID=A0ABX7PR26_9ACTN|nr:helix-turn-helix domain-containing protein [Nocardioides aromaticivorans]QSR28454.1 MerR family transcriptional regulator [Nocardioides aromaticivorans]